MTEGQGKPIGREFRLAVVGIDDPTYMTDDAWLGQLAAVAAKTAGSPRLKILLPRFFNHPEIVIANLKPQKQ